MLSIRTTPMRLAIGVAAVALAAAGCNSGGLKSDTATSSVTPVPVTAPAAVPGTITIQSFDFGSPLTVSPGQAITVVNMDPAPHTVTADDGHSFDTPVAPDGRAFLAAPKAPGRYPFHCTVHPTMHGTLVVT